MWLKFTRPKAAFMQKLLLGLAVIVVLHQNATQVYLMLGVVVGAFTCWQQRRQKMDHLHRPAVLPRNLQLVLWLLLAVSYLSLHGVDQLWACGFNYFYVVGQYVAVVWLFSRFGGPFAAGGQAEDGDLGEERAGGQPASGTAAANQPAASAGRPSKEEPFPLKLLKVMAVMGLVVIVLGLVQNILKVAPTDDWIDTDANPLLKTRVYSTWENPNILAGYLCMLGAYLMGFISTTGSKRERWYLLAYLLADLLCLVYTYSRGFWIAMACELILFVVCFYRRGIYYLLGAGAVGALLAGPAVWQRLSTLTSVHDTSAELRLAYLEIAANIIKEHPWGIGWYNYQFVFPQYDYFFKDPNVIMYHCHNLFLNITAELGVQGLVLFLALILILARLAWKLHKQGRRPWLQGMGRGYLLMLTGIMISGLGDHVFFNVRLGVLFWMLSILIPISIKYDEYC